MPLPVATVAGPTIQYTVFYFRTMWKSLCLFLASNARITNIIRRSDTAKWLARRFVPGETSASALTATCLLNRAGASAELDYLGDPVRTPEQAIVAAECYLELLGEIRARGLRAQVSPKPLPMGLALSDDLCLKNFHRIAELAEQLGNFVWVDMEGSEYTECTLALYRRLRACHDNVGLAVQANLRRTENDVKQLLAEGGTLRLCKGAFRESEDIAFIQKKEIDRNFMRLTELLLDSGRFQAIATHDSRMIEHAVTFAHEQRLTPKDFEFQMAYGVRNRLQEQVLRAGYSLRVYLAYGSNWFPYFMRRLGMRPSNALFLIADFSRRGKSLSR